jgi:hypothetical protein
MKIKIYVLLCAINIINACDVCNDGCNACDVCNDGCNDGCKYKTIPKGKSLLFSYKGSGYKYAYLKLNYPKGIQHYVIDDNNYELYKNGYPFIQYTQLSSTYGHSTLCFYKDSKISKDDYGINLILKCNNNEDCNGYYNFYISKNESASKMMLYAIIYFIYCICIWNLYNR